MFWISGLQYENLFLWCRHNESIYPARYKNGLSPVGDFIQSDTVRSAVSCCGLHFTLLLPKIQHHPYFFLKATMRHL